MPTLTEELSALYQKARETRPPEMMEKLQADIDRLSQQGLATGLDIGEIAPDFTLPDALGKSVTLYDELKKGPVVLSFYRGGW